MIEVKGLAAYNSITGLAPYSFKRNLPLSNEVLIDILYCGICHADIHQAENNYGNTVYPFVPGHEIVGRVKAIGNDVTKFKNGDLVGVGYFLGSCGHCPNCLNHEEQYCENGITPTQNGRLPGGETTKGGYSDSIVVNEDFIVSIPKNLDTARVAPLLCAGITTYSVLKYNLVKPGHRIGILGLGGLGHMAVKFAVSFGAEVTVLSSTSEKEKDAKDLGVHYFINTSDKDEVKRLIGSFDFIVDTVSAKHDINLYLRLLKKDGTLVLLGVPVDNPILGVGLLTSLRKKITGSFVGSIEDTQQMLNYCATKGITADVELISPDYINIAYKRMIESDVRYRFVIDMKKL
ncbi:NAD(P)-dependent alcohol dehydrogenase [Sphingobacterium sp. WOUb80]|uniref:NAD(P)-dependent alcohol dehydrogenase n=1 Tax=Sphingobacterium sp. WOUb80 TaxID=3234028 RepID=UPI003CF2CB78